MIWVSPVVVALRTLRPIRIRLPNGGLRTLDQRRNPRHQTPQHSVSDDQVDGCGIQTADRMMGGRGQREQDGLLAERLADRNQTFPGNDHMGCRPSEQTLRLVVTARTRDEDTIADGDPGAFHRPR
jgi:hypothetical protein